MHDILIEPIFSVPIFTVVFDGLSHEMNLGVLVREEIDNNRVPNNSVYSVEQSYPELHLKKEIKPLCDKIVDVVKQLSNEVLFFNSEYNVEITAMWANIQKPHTYFGRHRYHNNMFSGVFYVTGGTPIKFWNPVDSQFKPTINEYNQFNSASNTQPATKDALIIFPAYLDHSVEPNSSDKDRVSISFNIMLRGEYDIIDCLKGVSL